jgi:hypothetical protein
MTKKELIKAMADFDDNDVAIIVDRHGWWNIDRVEQDGSQMAIVMAEEFPPFTSDRD